MAGTLCDFRGRKLTAMVRSPGGGAKRWFRLADGLTSYRTSTVRL